MRPDSIKKFDLFFLASIAIAVVQALMNYETMEAAVGAQLETAGLGSEMSAILPISLAVGFALQLLLWFLISRLRLGWVRWVLLAFVAYRALSIPLAVSSGVASLSITGVIAALLQIIALWFVFQPDAREWFASRSD